MAYPCFVCGEETGPECLCEDCKKELPQKIVNGQWCPKHQIIHWRGELCPMCVEDKRPAGKCKYEIWKDGHLYMYLEDKADAHKLYDVVRRIFKPRVLVLYEKETTTRLLRDND